LRPLRQHVTELASPLTPKSLAPPLASSQPNTAKANQIQPGKATATATPTPVPTSTPAPAAPYAAIPTTTDAPPEFSTVTNQKKQKTQTRTLLPKPQPTADRKLIIPLSKAPTVPAAAETKALRIINKTIVDHRNITHSPCLTAHITNSNALVVIVCESYLATDYSPYRSILQQALRQMDSLSLVLALVRDGLDVFCFLRLVLSIQGSFVCGI
jgi:hypothetical protein